jgi:hypothetical protein
MNELEESGTLIEEDILDEWCFYTDRPCNSTSCFECWEKEDSKK